MAFIMIFLLIIIPILISYHQKLDMEKDILLSSLKGFGQLMLLGIFVTYIFSIDHLYFIFIYIILMIIIASLNASKRGDVRGKSFIIVFASISFTVIFTVSLWVSFSIIPLKAQYLIPVSGMLIGNAMVACAVVLEAMNKEKEELNEIDLKRKVLRIAMIPTIDGLKTVGLVQIPGTMTGMILAGGNPFESVKYQIFIIFTLMIVAALSSILTCTLYYKHIKKFNMLSKMGL
ncbi:iron export ABC transporter permease subunit FetB [Bacillus sp. cl95]|uniref:ABC transporter permease n=2 Tax=unclassified Bacillus (in: firmicutes) TaxID=185979 RepID=UPI00158716EA|nr:iron export ABC transporter permease subunit FetB [Bacillus sp. cl95]